MFGFRKKMFRKFPVVRHNKDLNEYNKRFTEPFGEVGHDGRNNIILSQDIFLSMDNQKTRRNTHVCVMGGAGSGKTYNFIIPNMLQANSSYVISDPGGYLYRDYAGYLEYMGYKVKCLNLVQMDKGNHYNPFRYIRSDTDVERLVKTLIANTTPIGPVKGDPFWEKTETALLTALVACLHEFNIYSNQNFSMIMQLLRAAQVSMEDNMHQDDDNACCPLLDELFENKEIRALDPESFAFKQYNDFRVGTGRHLRTIQEVLRSCIARLQAFDLPDIAKLTKTDDIDLESMGDEKTALFIITPTGDTTFSFLTAMMYKQLFQVTYNYCETTAPFTQLVLDGNRQVVKAFRADNEYESMAKAEEARKWLESAKNASIVHRKDMGWYELILDNGETAAFRGSEEEAQKALDLFREGCVVANSERSNSGQRLPIHVRMLFDDFTGIGYIPRFEAIVATSRKYELSIDITLQSLAQAKSMYGYNWADIVSNCDTLVYLGGGADLETVEWLADIALRKEGMLITEASHEIRCKQIRDMADDTCIVLPRGFTYTGKKYITNLHPMWNLAKELKPYIFWEEKSKRLSSGEWGKPEKQEIQPEENQE